MRRLLVLFASFLTLSSCLCSGQGGEVKVLYWNIQNGMWHDQGNNYDNFVAYVRELDPDICIWAEAESRYLTDKAEKMQMPEEQYLPWNWDLLAARYGHAYTLLCGKRDTFPQVITSKYPLKIARRVNGNGSDIIVAHGAGWAVVQLPGGEELNVVTLHTWPQKFAYLAQDEQADAAAHGGDRFRAREMQFICEQTIGTDPCAKERLWLMAGDFNAISSVDNFHYQKSPDDPAFLVHDYVRGSTPYIDVIERFYPGDFQKTTVSGKRIDMVYVTPALFEKVVSARVLREGFADCYRDPRGKDIHNFCHPSDHFPVFVTFKP